MTWQVAEVTRPLLSVGKICDTGHQVTFGRSGGVITDLVTGEEYPFLRDASGMYQLEFWIVAKDGPNAYAPSQGFPGPGR